ncbi:hypothetical protein BKA70DRAFT_1149695 [Coprinopsis sp. MPI-PUGE-AT-0042]|nr:hypothetical protein BKA70DRAFT_1149695 [Coprinopsis sp. MPI-PUGE-AT-0042]
MSAALEKTIIYSLRTSFAHAVAATSVAALEVFMWIYMASFYLEAPLETRKRRRPYLIASLVILILSSAAAVLDSLFIYTTLFKVVPGPENAMDAYGIMGAEWDRWLRAAGLLWDTGLRVCDAVLLYRCYIVWAGRPWVVVPPVCIFLAGIGTTLVGVGIRSYIPWDSADAKLNTADISLNVGLNIIITLLISYRLIRAHKQLKEALPNTSHKVYLGIVSILVESAAPLTMFGIGAIVTLPLYKTDVVAWRVSSVFEILYNMATVLAPQLIIFRVATGSSWANQTDTSMALSHGIAFAGTDSQIKSDEESN